MALLKMLGIPRHQIFVGNDRFECKQVDSPREKWARAHGYQNPPSERTYAIFENGVCVREWLILDQSDDDGAS